jgi:hypothetical protein
MEPSCETVAEALRSSESESVNSAIDEIKELEPDERIRLFEECFEIWMEIYEKGDGYQRQSVTRVVEAIDPGLGLAAYDLSDGGRFSDDVSPDQLREATDQSEAFFLAALQDDDGRVRHSAKRGLKEICLGYDMIGEEQPIQSLADELADLAEQATGKTQDHIEDTHEQTVFYLRPPGERALRGLQQ